MKLTHKITLTILIFCVIPFLLIMNITLINIKNLQDTTKIYTEEITSSNQNISKDIVENLGKEIILQKAKDVAKQVEIYITSHPNMTVSDLQNDSYFQKIAVQPVGKTGYTALTDYETLICRFHSSPKIVDVDLSTLATKLPGFWSIMSKTKNGFESEGFYNWIEPDNTTRQKYMYIAIINATTADGVGMTVAATTYIDEFSIPANEFTEKSEETKNNLLEESDEVISLNLNQSITVFFVSVILVILAAFIVTRNITKPIGEFTKSVKEISNGNLDISLNTKSSGEIGELAMSFNQMMLDLKKSQEWVKKHSEDLEKQVNERTEDLEKSKKRLEEKMYELEKLNKISIGRELKMIELKNKIKELGGRVEEDK